MKQFDQDLLRHWVFSAISFAAALFLLISLCAMCGCTKTVYLPSESRSVSVDTDSLTRLVREFTEQSSSARERETVYVYETLTNTYTLNEQGDTTRADTSRERTTDKSRELEVTNRLLVARIDSLQHLLARKDSASVREPYPVEKIVEVPRKRGWWETLLLWTGGIAIAGVLLIIYRHLAGKIKGIKF